MTGYAVYRIYDETGELLYIGCSGQFKERMRYHRKNQPWADRIARVEHELVDFWMAAIEREAELIREHQPPFNIKHTNRDPRGPGKRRRGWS